MFSIIIYTHVIVFIKSDITVTRSVYYLLNSRSYNNRSDERIIAVSLLAYEILIPGLCSLCCRLVERLVL